MIRVFDNLESLSQEAAEIFIDLAQQSIHSRGRFSVALSGGSTPRRLYEILASDAIKKAISWQSVHVFWGDERCVPQKDPRSNFRMAREALLEHVALPAENIHAVQSDLQPDRAAMEYEWDLEDYFGNQLPVFDLILLGLGDNAHTASLFPHTPVLSEQHRLVAEVYVPELEMYRVTFTAPLINQARQVVFLVSGSDKAIALQYVLEGDYQPDEYPAQLIRPTITHPLWLVDKAAAHRLHIATGEVN